MEALRRARLLWAIACIAVGGGLALVLAFAPQAQAYFIGLTLWTSTWLWLPLYTRMPTAAKAAAVWFLGVVPLALFSDDMPAARIVVLALAGVVVAAVAWVLAGLRRRAPNP